MAEVIPTPEQAQDLVEHFGSGRAAAAGVGVGQSTVWNWLNPEGAREKRRRYYATNRQRRYRAANRERRNAYYRERRRRLKAEGRCVQCAKNLAVTEVLCWDCADKLKEASHGI